MGAFRIFSGKKSFKFKEPKNTAVYTCESILNGTHPILYVIHDANGDWQFLSGDPSDTSEPKLVALLQMVEIDASLNELGEMPIGVFAERENSESSWRYFKAES